MLSSSDALVFSCFGETSCFDGWIGVAFFRFLGIFLVEEEPVHRWLEHIAVDYFICFVFLCLSCSSFELVFFFLWGKLFPCLRWSSLLPSPDALVFFLLGRVLVL